jgi:P27 family predicted phage terminase small subunit
MPQTTPGVFSTTRPVFHDFAHDHLIHHQRPARLLTMGSRGPLPKAAQPGAVTHTLPGTVEPLPPPPDWLSEEAKTEYNRVVVAAPALTARDAAMLCSYCEAVAEIAEHTRILREEGPSIKGHRGSVLNPRVKARQFALATLAETAQALGLTPAARARLPEQFSPKVPQSPNGPEAFAAMYGNDAA